MDLLVVALDSFLVLRDFLGIQQLVSWRVLEKKDTSLSCRSLIAPALFGTFKVGNASVHN